MKCMWNIVAMFVLLMLTFTFVAWAGAEQGLPPHFYLSLTTSQANYRLACTTSGGTSVHCTEMGR